MYCVVSNVDKVEVDGEIPVQLCNYTDVYHNEFIRPGLGLMRATASEAEIARFALSVDDVIITKDSEAWDDIGVPALVVETSDDLVCGYHLALLRPRKDVIDGAFLLRCLQAKPIQVQFALSANGVTRFGLSKSEIGATVVPVPPMPGQRAIVTYLNQEMARLDASLAETERLLRLLEEKRQALVTSVVTRGLNPGVPLCDSGIAWLGEIPEHWEVWKLGHIATVGNGSTPNRSRREYWGGGAIPWLNSSSVNLGEITAADQFVTKLAVRECHLPMVGSGSVLVAITGQGRIRGRAAVLSIDATINQHVAFISPRMKVTAWYLRWVLHAAYSYLRSISDDVGGTKGALTCAELTNLRVPVPPGTEQQKIVGEILSEARLIDELADATRSSVVLMKERRAALISGTVTGQIDVENGE